MNDPIPRNLMRIDPEDFIAYARAQGGISAAEERALYERAEKAHEKAFNSAINTFLADPSVGAALVAAAQQAVREDQAERAAEGELLRRFPLYASAPKVTGTFIMQQWEGPRSDFLQEVGRKEFTVPLTTLVENRDSLHEVADFQDNDWLAEEIGLACMHDGPFDITDIEDSIQAWLDATQGIEKG